MHFKINTESFTFTIVTQAARLVCFYFFVLFFVFFSLQNPRPALASLNLFSPEPTSSTSPKRVLLLRHTYFHTSASPRFHQHCQKISYVAKTYRKVELPTSLFYFYFYFYFFNDECLMVCIALAKSNRENMLGMFHS